MSTTGRPIAWPASWAGDELEADVYTFLAAIPLWVGVDLLRPGSTFATAQAWQMFARIMPSEDAWGVLFLLISAIGWMGMLTRRPRLKTVGLYVLALIHLTMGALFAIGSPLSAGSGTFAMIAILAFRFVRHRRRRQRPT